VFDLDVQMRIGIDPGPTTCFFSILSLSKRRK
jgi:hypothetical protein